jgi:hypothetical protein
MSEPAPTVGPAEINFADDLFRSGASNSQIEDKLVERGIDRQEAAKVVAFLKVRNEVTDRAADMLAGGMLPEQVARKLQDDGISPEAARLVVRDARDYEHQSREYDDDDEGMPVKSANPVLMVIGGIIFAIGVVIFVGNVTGLMPTFPCAGWLTLFVGASIWGAGKRK